MIQLKGGGVKFYIRVKLQSDLANDEYLLLKLKELDNITDIARLDSGYMLEFSLGTRRDLTSNLYNTTKKEIKRILTICSQSGKRGK